MLHRLTSCAIVALYLCFATSTTFATHTKNTDQRSQKIIAGEKDVVSSNVMEVNNAPVIETSTYDIDSTSKPPFNDSTHTNDTLEIDDEETFEDDLEKQRINKIIITGNKQVSHETIMHHIPYHLGEFFDPIKSGTTIRNLYALGNFRQIEFLRDDISHDRVNIHIVLHEKKRINEIKFIGNKHLLEMAIRKRIDFSKIPAIDIEELRKFSEIIKKMYEERGYHDAEITSKIEDTDDDKIDVIFEMDEGSYTVVKRVFFEGNKKISSKILRNSIFTREDWLLSIFDSAGTYHPNAIEQDKHTIETMYQNQGFLGAKVIDIKTEKDPDRGDFLVTFYIEEGEPFTITEVNVPGNEIMDEEEIRRVLPIRKGQRYSRARVQKTIELLRALWGEHGYIYADVEPSVQPDETDKTVKIALYSELGHKVRLNRINIIGNKKTRDTIIRRNITLEEGEILKNSHMERSKERVSSLGSFDRRDGVNWKINRINDELCDLDLILKEIKTGKFEIKAGTGGNEANTRSAVNAFTVDISASNPNAGGRGIHYTLGTSFSRQNFSGHGSISQPWLFDKPILGTASLVASTQSYDDLINNVQGRVNERRLGGSAGLGFFLPSNAQTLFEIGAERLSYAKKPEAAQAGLTNAQRQEFQAMLDRRFESGTSLWITNVTNKDTRNHPLHPARGHQWNFNSKLGIPTKSASTPNAAGTSYTASKNPTGTNSNAIIGTNFGFFRFEADASWYTPLIGENSLVFCIHGHAGVVTRLGNHTIPYRELFHVGGPATVRGFHFGEISPAWRPSLLNGDPIGATKAFWVNSELIAPLTPDFNYKAAVFYDGGAGWDAPDSELLDKNNLKNNGFNYRHSIGFGFRLLNPTNIQIDWGIKLDRNKKIGEPLTEVHLSMQHSY